MGIQGLTSFVTKRSHVCMEKYKLHDTELVIDGDSTAYQLYSVYFAPKNCCFSGDYDRFGDLIRLFFRTLLDCKVVPYIVFDGGYEERKMGTILGRMKDRIRSAEKLNPASSEILFPLFLGEIFKDIALEFNIKVIRCDYEGDLESAKIAKYLNCPVLSCDSDFYIFGILYIPFTSLKLRSLWRINRKPDHGEQKSFKFIYCEIYRVDKFLKDIGLQKELLPLLGVLLGNDYIKRRDFFNLFQTMDKHRAHPKSKTPDLIQLLVNFLCKETKESAIQKVLAVCNKSVQSRIAETINTTIEGYMLDQNTPSEYQKYFNGEVLSSECKEDESNLKQFISKTGLSPVVISKFLNNFRRGLYPSCFINILIDNVYHVRPQVEDTTLQNSHVVNFEIISCIHKILKPQSEQLKFFGRVGGNHEEHIVPPCNISLPTIIDLETMDLSDRQQTLYDILGVNKDFVDNCLNLFPDSWKLYILVINYLSTKSSINWSFIYCLLVCKIVINYVDVKVDEFIRDPDRFFYRFKKTVCDILINKSDNVDLKTTIKDAVNNIAYDDSLIALKNLIPFFQVKSELTNNPKLFNRRLVHSASQFQSCLYHVKFLNILLKSPFEDCVISDCFNGTFIYNLNIEVRNRPNENYIKFLLQNSPTVFNCFNLMVLCLKKYISTDF